MPAGSTQPKSTSSTASCVNSRTADGGADSGGAEFRRGDVLQVALKGANGRTRGANDDDGVLCGHCCTSSVANQRGAMRRAPSSRMVSPFSMVFSKMCLTSVANSSGRPRRAGKGTLLPSAS